MRCGLYVLAQCAGAVFAVYGAMHTIGIPGRTRSGWNFLSGPEGNTIVRGFVTECVLTFLLVLVCFAAIDPKKKEKRGALGPVGVALAIAVAHLIAVPITGCGVNPARSLAP